MTTLSRTPEAVTGRGRRRCVATAVVVAAVVTGVVAALRRVRRVVVVGGSMRPTLEPGDRLLVVRSRRFGPGDLVAVPDPRCGSRLLVKRVAARHGDAVVLVGDAPDASTDSRVFGPVPARSVAGRVLHRYAPAGRAGRVGGRARAASPPAGTIDAMDSPSVELDRLFSPDYLQGLSERSLEDLRAMRAECDRAETAVSYLRRVAQGRLDIVQGVLQRAGTDHALADLVEDLGSIIGGGPPRPAGPGRLPSRMAPDVEIDGLTGEIDAVLDAARIGELPDMDETELRDIAEQLIVVEGRISHQRRMLHERIDALQAEIVSRYKSGQASPDGLLT